MTQTTSKRRIVARRAPAKVNLALSVGPAREPDGLHPISSWFAPIDLADELEVTRLEPDRMSRYAVLWHADAPRSSAIDWSIVDDLAVRAHRRLEDEFTSQLPVQLKLEKRIPVGGGLGGGSSDAAAMLLATRELFDLEIDDQRLMHIGLELGSDVPYFLHGGSAVVEGVGDRIEPAPEVGESWLVLIVPEFGCATGAVYRAFDEGCEGALRAGEVRRLARARSIEPEDLFNDLARWACRIEPRLEALRTRAGEVSAQTVHVTGSGSTMFICCRSGASAALALKEALEPELEGCAVVACRLGGG